MKKSPYTRREFLKAGSVLGSTLAFPSLVTGAAPAGSRRPGRRPRVALIATEYWNISHADVIATKIFTRIPTDDGSRQPRVDIVSAYIDQFSEKDTGRRILRMNNVPLYPTIAEALTMGGSKLAVDAVLYIGEHGDYPQNRIGQKMYPRMNHMEQVFRVFDASNRSVPVFHDKHLSYNWLDCRWIYERAQELKVPMMAGSSLPFCWRDPDLVHPIGTEIEEAIAIGHASLDSASGAKYGFHAAEILQCMVERRKGGETGIASVQGLTGNAVWQAIDRGDISSELVHAGVESIQNAREGDMRQIVSNPRAIIVKYKDGTKGTVLMINEKVRSDWAYAAKANGRTVATEFVGSRGPIYAHFSYLTLNIEEFFVTGRPQAPVERTYLTSVMTDFSMRSIALENSRELAVPELNVAYNVEGIVPIRPTAPRPTGDSIGQWPPDGYDFIVNKRFR